MRGLSRRWGRLLFSWCAVSMPAEGLGTSDGVNVTVKFNHCYRDMAKRPRTWKAFVDTQVLRAFRMGQIRSYGPSAWLPAACGVTICTIHDDAGEEIGRGYAFCSAKDQFCRRTGRRIAEGRARAAAEQPKG